MHQRKSRNPFTIQQIDLAKAREQHRAYVDTLRAAGLSVTSLPADEKYADCVFTEDAAVIVGDHALVTNPGVASRKGETGRMREILESLGLIVMDIKVGRCTTDSLPIH